LRLSCTKTAKYNKYAPKSRHCLCNCYFEEGNMAYREVLSPGQLLGKLYGSSINRCDICGINGKDYTVDDIVYDKEKKRYFVSVFEARLDNEESPL